MVVSVLLGEDDDPNIAAVKSDDENTAMAMPKINIAVVVNKIFLIKDEYNIPNAWWVMFGEVGVTSYM
ncbi:MAG TPA: hypothetical protein VK553_00960 [Candidatus Nitrosopolaris rasttigaisensis]|jgi:hypothetical protein|nr:hypothetical protein [Candidatus Nitrosopolaris rasttigaisensis]